MTERCPWAITFGTISTRCNQAVGHPGFHVGPGLGMFDYQTIEWGPGDRREYRTDRTDIHAWESPS